MLKDTAVFPLRKAGRSPTCWWMPSIIATRLTQRTDDGQADHTRLRSHRGRGVPPPRRDGWGALFAIADELAAKLFSAGSPADLIALRRRCRCR